jgi:hypothetical protein
MARCAGFKPNGAQCERIVDESRAFCYAHDPRKAQQRSRASSRGARGKPAKEVAEIKSALHALAEDLHSGKMDPKIGAVINQVLNTLLRAVALEREMRVDEELTAEIEELKREIDGRTG